jgi:hypothetical protein
MSPRTLRSLSIGLRNLALLGVSLAITVCSDGGGTGPARCEVTAVTVDPDALTLGVGVTATVTAQLTSSNCIDPPVIVWSSSDSSQVAIHGNGGQAEVTGAALTTLRSPIAARLIPVTISAATANLSGSSLVTVVEPADINLSADSVGFAADYAGTDPPSQDVTITSGGPGILSGLVVGPVSYGVGASGWLRAPVLSGTSASPSATLTLQPVTGALTEGTYTATLTVASTVAPNSPREIAVTFTVGPPPPEITLSATTLDFVAAQGGPNPASQTITIKNTGGGTLTGLGVGTITYGPGAAGWLQPPVLGATQADPEAALTLQPVTGALRAGTYTATVPVTSSVASNSPQEITVTFTVGPPPPAIALSSTALSFTATQLGDDPASQVVTITNSGGGTLSGLGINSIVYGPGAAGWLQAPVLSSTTANPSATVTIQPVTGSLPAGTYTATIPISSALATNTPQTITVQFTLAPAPPRIGVAPATPTFTAIEGGANPASQTVTITNTGGGTLSGLAVGTIVYGNGATGWLGTPTLSGTTANPSVTLTLRPVTGTLAPGGYTATVPITSSVASNSPQNVSVTFTVTAPAPTITLTPSARTFTAIQGGANPSSQTIAITNGGGGTLTGLAVGTVSYGAGAAGWLQAPTLSGTTANPSVTLTLQPVTGSLSPGTYTASVPITSSVASNSPQTVAVTFTVAPPTPQIALSSAALSFSATAGGVNPASQVVTITNGGAGTLTGLAVGTITYGAGATGWLQAPVLSGTTANPSVTLTLQAVTGALPVGTYTATVPVTSGVASNSPQTVTVTFAVAPPAPSISLSATSRTFNGAQGGANPPSQTVTITNGGGGTLSGLAVGTVTFGGGATGWLQSPTLSGTTANPSVTMTLQAVTGSLAPGSYTATVPITSTVASNSPQNVTVTFVVASPPSAVTAFAGDGQTGLVGFALNVRPAVRVTDGSGGPVPNLSVTFAVASGGGSATNLAATTNANGVAQVGSWVLGAAPGANTLTATVAGTGLGGNPLTFTATGVAGSFNITVQNVGPPLSAAAQSAFNTAAAKWQQIIYQDLPDAVGFTAQAGQCGDNSPAVGPLLIDDVMIFARIDSIDGPGGVLGSAGPCFIRSSDRLTILGQMTFDSADVAGLVTAGSLNAVILHEMGHVLGFGTLWNQPQFNCLREPSSPPGSIEDTYFACAQGRAMFDSLGGTSYTGGNKVPVENCGPASPPNCGSGTVNGHWREPVFNEELMTGFLQPGVSNPLSRLTAAAMADLGYTVNYAGADPFVHTFNLVVGGPSGAIQLGDDLYRGPIYVVDRRNGSVVEVITPR